MDTVRTALFEEPLYVYLALAVAELVIAVLWHERRSMRLAAALIVPPALAGIVFAAATLVVTDREAILSAAGEIARDVAAGRSDAARKYLDDDFLAYYRGRRLGRSEAIEIARAERERYSIETIKLTNESVEVRDDVAEMRVTAVMNFGADIGGRRSVPVVFLLRWIRTPEGWLISEADDIHVGLN